MQITVRLLASYRQYLPDPQSEDPSFQCLVAPGARLDDVLDRLVIPQTEVYTFFVNGRHAERAQLLADGDVVSVFPAVGGG